MKRTMSKDKVDEKSEICTFSFKKHNRKNQTTRKRKDSSEDDDVSAVVKKDKKSLDATNPLVQSTGTTKRKDASTTNEDIRTENINVSYKSSKIAMPSGPQDMGATSTLDIETDAQLDAQAIFERSQAVTKNLKGMEEDNIYRGLNNYAVYIEKKDSVLGNASSGMVRKGPIRAPTNIRSTVRWDYQPDICKDYKETGFCGFGDSCKFLHDRGDYKHGWQLEREMDEGSYGKSDEKSYEIDSDDDDLPFKCYLCRQSFVDPVVTKCKHYFCEKCALAHYRKSQRCFVCGQQTSGVFNPAKDVIARLSTSQLAKNEASDDSS